jgi:hypothetical protein
MVEVSIKSMTESLRERARLFDGPLVRTARELAAKARGLANRPSGTPAPEPQAPAVGKPPVASDDSSGEGYGSDEPSDD